MSLSIKQLFFTALVGLTMTGCATASKFSCPVPNGTTCMSAREVYEATNGVDTLENTGSKNAARSRKHADRTATEYGAPQASTVAAVIEDDSLRLVSAQVEVADADTYVPQVQPLRTPAKVMRIWVTPFQDGAGDLHMPGYVMTEIESRRWEVGVLPPTESPDLHLVSPAEPTMTADASPAPPAATTPVATN